MLFAFQLIFDIDDKRTIKHLQTRFHLVPFDIFAYYPLIGITSAQRQQVSEGQMVIRCRASIEAAIIKLSETTNQCIIIELLLFAYNYKVLYINQTSTS